MPPKRKFEQPKQLLTKFFVSVVGPAPAPEVSVNAPFFPSDDRSIRVPHHNGGNYRRVLSTDSGSLYGDCGGCSKKYIDFNQFVPDECLQNNRNRPEFLEHIAAYNDAYKAKDLNAARVERAWLAENRPAYCRRCRVVVNTPTGTVKTCRDFWFALKAQKCAEQDGCANQDCVERGPNAANVLEADHVDPTKKVEKVSDYIYWASNGGVEAMRLEAEKCRFICRFCHRLERTGHAANRTPDPATLPDGNCMGTTEEKAVYKRKWRATITFPKQQHVDAEKLRRCCCLTCKRVVTKATCFAFDFDHRDPETKTMGGLAGPRGGVGGLVNNNVNRACLEKIRDILDNEMQICDLLCVNCHKRKTISENK